MASTCSQDRLSPAGDDGAMAANSENHDGPISPTADEEVVMTTGDLRVEVDPRMEADSFSGLNTDEYDAQMESSSLTSSVYAYVFENGRRYQAYYGIDRTFIPNDEDEQSRLDLHHEIFLLMLDGELHLAPVTDPKWILDLGTGTGIWAIDMADKFPEANVIGTDLCPIQPGWVPPNCRFEVDDMEASDGLLYPDDHFDFIHIRNLCQSIGDWDSLMNEVWRKTKPGGWVELAELGAVTFCDDAPLAVDNPVNVFLKTLSSTLEQVGRPWPDESTLSNRLLSRGFINVQAVQKKQPSGPWPKDPKLKHIGMMALLGSHTGYHSYGMAAFTRVLGMPQDEAEKMCADALATARLRSNHTYTLLYDGLSFTIRFN
ncbi:S-adenosyl-L-methionine-dependent methyltransferase [Peziza echinospora]|nr:S-adenosyl-L-methionine-dependent methyltransferase [Peziza echinospora]